MKKKLTGALATIMMISCLVPFADAQYHPAGTLEVSVTGVYNVTAHSTIKYTPSQVSQINLLNHNENYVTIEHRAKSSSDSIVKMGIQTNSNYYTTLPNPYFDREDDDGNGWYEESEVTILGQLVGNKSYTFSSFYTKDSSVGGGIVQLNSQRSVKNTPWNEYNTVPLSSTNLTSARWPSTRSLGEALEMNVQNAQEDAKQLLFFAASSENELNSHVDNIYSSYENLIEKESGATRSRIEWAEGTITFNEPISMGQLNALLQDSNSKLIEYQAKFININGDWCTVGGSNMDESDMIMQANILAENYGQPHISYEGIVSAKIIFDKNSDAYQIVKQSSLVYFLDMSKEIWKHYNYDTDAKVMVPSYAWDIAGFKEQLGD